MDTIIYRFTIKIKSMRIFKDMYSRTYTKIYTIPTTETSVEGYIQAATSHCLGEILQIITKQVAQNSWDLTLFGCDLSRVIMIDNSLIVCRGEELNFILTKD
eukprot:9879_1